MPAYNAEKYLREAIDSILGQTFTDFEFIIVNDGSTDRTKEIIFSYSDPRIVYIENEYNLGICVTLNRGIDAAHGRYIARMDSDDISLPDRFERQVAYLDIHPEIGVLGSLVVRISDDGTTIDCPPSEINPYECRASLLFSTCLAHPAAMLRTSILKKYKLNYDDYFRGMEDFHLWWKMSHYTQITNIEEVLLKYRIHHNQITQISVNDEFLNRHRDFVMLRLSDFVNDVSNEDIECIIKYMFYPDSFEDESLEIFIQILSRIIKSIKQNKNFYNAQKLVAGKAISFAHDHSVSNLKKSNIHYMIKAHKSSCMPMFWLIKRLYHEFIS